MSRKQRIRGHYEHRVASGRANHDVLDWTSAASQEARFVVLADNVDLSGRSLLDVGSGLGDLCGFLKRRRIAVEYTGVDILEKMVQAARRRHRDGRFLHADIFQGDPFGDERFDVVFCSGTFNLNLGNNREFLPTAVARMLELAREHVVFNLLHARYAGSDGTYFYHDPDDVRAMLRDLPCELRLLDDYLPNDFTVICRPDAGTG